MRRLILIFFIVAIRLRSDEAIILSRYCASEWRVQCGETSSNELLGKWLVIGNNDFQIRQMLAMTKKIHVKRETLLNEGKLFVEISFCINANKGSFRLSQGNKYFMFDHLVVHSGKRNVWISSVVPRTEMGVTYFGNPNGSLRNSQNDMRENSICVWIENMPSIPNEYYLQDKSDMLKILPCPVKSAKDLDDFIKHKGTPYLSPLLSMKYLAECGKCEKCKLQLSALQENLCYTILRFDSGKTDLLSVLLSCQKLFFFYQAHSSTTELSEDLDKKLALVKSMILHQKKLYFESGID